MALSAAFLFGPLCHPPLFEAVAGHALEAGPARLPGWRAAPGKHGPVLVEDSGAEVRGVCVDLAPEALARADFYAAVSGHDRHAVTVGTETGNRQALLWRRGTVAEGGPGAWRLADWVAEHGARRTLAAAEVMRAFGREDPSQVAHRLGMIESRAQSALAAAGWRRRHIVGRAASRDDVELLDRDPAYDGFQTVEVLRARFRRFAGDWSAPVDRVVTRIADAVTVLPYDPVRDRILLVEQIRIGALGNGDAAPWLIEPIAGLIDAGETPEHSGRREALEEAGLSLGAFHPVGRYYPSPGGIAQVFHSYVAEAELPDGAAGIGGAASEHEDILSHVLDYDSALAAYHGGDMANAALLTSFQWLMLNRARLRSPG